MKESVSRFEDLDAWKIARELTNRIYNITKKDPIARDYGFVDQIRRAAVSVMNNTCPVKYDVVK